MASGKQVLHGKHIDISIAREGYEGGPYDLDTDVGYENLRDVVEILEGAFDLAAKSLEINHPGIVLTMSYDYREITN